jgi:signal transduction histidine kinase
VVVSLHPSPDWSDGSRAGIRLTVADSGSGIREEHVDRLFEPFFTTKHEKGTGLGLWVVRGIVAKHEGTIRIRTRQAETRSGTVVSILWPTAATQTSSPCVLARIEVAEKKRSPQHSPG